MKNRFRFARARAIAKKEFMHIMRDPFTLGMAVGVPVIMVLFFGFAIDFNFKNIKLAVFDFDKTQASRELARSFDSSGYFITKAGDEAFNPIKVVESEKAFSSLVVNPGFAKKIAVGESAKVQILIDGADNLKSGVVSGYLSGIQRAVIQKITGVKISNPIDVSARYMFNPELDTRWFVVPGLIVVIIGLLSVLMTALTVAREWENGSMELLLSTPVTPIEVIIGKITPYVFLELTAIAFVFLISIGVFGVPFAGSFIVFVFSCLLFISTSLAQGILISIVTRQQQKAMQLSMLSGFLPALLLSGFIFPIESMPLFFRILTMFLPARWFMEIIREVFLKGSVFMHILPPIIFLAIINSIMVMGALKKFKRELD